MGKAQPKMGLSVWTMHYQLFLWKRYFTKAYDKLFGSTYFTKITRVPPILKQMKDSPAQRAQTTKTGYWFLKDQVDQDDVEIM